MFVHSSRIEKQFEYLAMLGIDTNPLLKQTGISVEELSVKDKHFSLEQYKTVLDFALRQTSNPEYGLDCGKQPYLGGTIGTMSASCPNLKEAIIQGCRYLAIMGDFADLQFVDDDAEPKLIYTLVESWVLDSPHTAKLEVDVMFSFINTILKFNSNNSLKPKHLRLTCTKPVNHESYLEVFGVNPLFEADANELIFDNAALLIPMKAFNPETFQLLSVYLESQLDQLYRTEKLTDKVKRILHSSFKYQFPDIESVAERLNLSTRTLQRKLSEEQTSFKNILQETRFGIAKQLLKQNTFSISEISYILGYADLGNFSRSFKKYVGASPQAYKENS
jgi:AraC-like DNA-binding protein